MSTRNKEKLYQEVKQKEREESDFQAKVSERNQH